MISKDDYFDSKKIAEEFKSLLPDNPISQDTAVHIKLLEANRILWKLEDIVRKDLPDKRIADTKRAIDKQNLKRNRIIEEVDKAYLELIREIHGGNLNNFEKQEMHTESPGMIIDRLSILSLRVRFLNNQGSKDQQQDLIEATEIYFKALKDGKKRFSTCRFLKQYG